MISRLSPEILMKNGVGSWIFRKGYSGHSVLSKRERLRQPVPQVLAAHRAELGDDIPILAVSAEAGAGLEELRHKIAEMIRKILCPAADFE